MTHTSAPASDRRAQRTRRALRDALDLLIREKSYGSIPVQEILNRADVGRSTFFTYFRDKDQLLASSIYHTVDQARAAAPEFTDNQIQRILSLSLPLLEELDRDRRAAGEAEEGELNPKRYHWLRKSFAERIAAELGQSGRRSALTLGKVPSALLIHYLTSRLMLVIEWWVESGSDLSPAEVNHVFRRLVLRVLEPASAEV